MNTTVRVMHVKCIDESEQAAAAFIIIVIMKLTNFRIDSEIYQGVACVSFLAGRKCWPQILEFPFVTYSAYCLHGEGVNFKFEKKKIKFARP